MAAPYRDVDALLTEHARERGDRVYLECLAPAARLTFAELDALTNRLAHFLADRGLRANDRVSVLGDNCAE
jgi:acyl-CoA synthetase (AMP-forming)/AMP-acid ligase II